MGGIWVLAAAIETISLTKAYGKVKAVNDLSLQVEPGEMFCFLGPNGAGKTTTIKMLIGLVKPTSGRALVAGADVWAEGIRAKSHIGYVPDFASLYEQLTALEFLNFVADMFRMGRPERAAGIEHLLEVFELTAAARQPLGSYSRGMKQKVVIAAALLHRPRVLFLDEPTVGLDPKSARLLKDLLRQACAGGTAVFMSTHILEIAENMADRVGIIQRGRLLFQGTVPELRGAERAADGSSLEDLFLQLTATDGEAPLDARPGRAGD
jgi:ABC-2 type transport system ATP-binding protein